MMRGIGPPPCDRAAQDNDGRTALGGWCSGEPMSRVPSPAALPAIVAWRMMREASSGMRGRRRPYGPGQNGRMLARLEIMDDGHLFLVTRPVESARIIEGFLAQA